MKIVIRKNVFLSYSIRLGIILVLLAGLLTVQPVQPALAGAYTCGLRSDGSPLDAFAREA
ncbi:MAG: hypothetical protein MUO77_14010 [Anaerolineales bacterium]|nr:hypothetical protein [Anaerolineales bacterium]